MQVNKFYLSPLVISNENRAINIEGGILKLPAVNGEARLFKLPSAEQTVIEPCNAGTLESCKPIIVLLNLHDENGKPGGPKCSILFLKHTDPISASAQQPKKTNSVPLTVFDTNAVGQGRTSNPGNSMQIQVLSAWIERFFKVQNRFHYGKNMILQGSFREYTGTQLYEVRQEYPP